MQLHNNQYVIKQNEMLSNVHMLPAPWLTLNTLPQIQIKTFQDAILSLKPTCLSQMDECRPNSKDKSCQECVNGTRSGKAKVWASPGSAPCAQMQLNCISLKFSCYIKLSFEILVAVVEYTVASTNQWQ